MEIHDAVLYLSDRDQGISGDLCYKLSCRTAVISGTRPCKLLQPGVTEADVDVVLTCRGTPLSCG